MSMACHSTCLKRNVVTGDICGMYYSRADLTGPACFAVVIGLEGLNKVGQFFNSNLCFYAIVRSNKSTVLICPGDR